MLYKDKTRRKIKGNLQSNEIHWERNQSPNHNPSNLEKIQW